MKPKIIQNLSITLAVIFLVFMSGGSSIASVTSVEIPNSTSVTAGINATTPSSSGTATTPATNPNCPQKAPEAGPTDGKDVRMEIAKAFESEASKMFANDYGEVSGGPDTKTEELVVKIAKQFAPDQDGKTKYKYSIDGDGPNSFDCSGFVHYVLKQAKTQGGNLILGGGSHTSQYVNVGSLVHKVDLSKFVSSSGGSILRKTSDLPFLDILRPGDLIFFGTSTSCADKKKCPNTVGHIGIYIGNGQYIHSTTSDEDPTKDSASSGNSEVSPAIPSRPQGANYASYNGVKISSLSESYFTPDFYIMTRRVIQGTGVYGMAEGLGPTAYPGGNNASVSLNSCHGSTKCHPGERSGHGAYQNRPNGDAVDITPKSGYAYAAFGGTAQSGGSGRNSYTVLTSANGRVKAYYYHTNNIRTGPVNAGERIAKVGAGGIGHIHFELLVDGKSVHGHYVVSESSYQADLWKNMKAVLGLT